MARGDLQESDAQREGTLSVCPYGSRTGRDGRGSFICPVFLYLIHHQEAQTRRSVRFLRERSRSRSLDPGTCRCTNTAQNKAGRRGEEGKAKRMLSKKIPGRPKIKKAD